MKQSNTALIELKGTYDLDRNSDIKQTSSITKNKIYSLPFNYEEVSDEALVSVYVNNNDQEAFNQIVGRYNEIIIGFAMKLIKNAQDAEEVRQDVFLILVTKLHTFKGNSKFSTWLYRITLNTCYKYLNDSNKRATKEIHLDDSFFNQMPAKHQWSKTPDEVTLLKERMDIIGNAVNELTENNQKIFKLKDVKGFSNAEVGEAMGLSISAVKSRVLRNRLTLKEKISDHFTSA